MWIVVVDETGHVVEHVVGDVEYGHVGSHEHVVADEHVRVVDAHEVAGMVVEEPGRYSVVEVPGRHLAEKDMVDLVWHSQLVDVVAGMVAEVLDKYFVVVEVPGKRLVVGIVVAVDIAVVVVGLRSG
jgi:hypothetical protein